MNMGVAKCGKCGLEAAIISTSETQKAVSVSTEKLQRVCHLAHSLGTKNECKFLSEAIILEIQKRGD